MSWKRNTVWFATVAAALLACGPLGAVEESLPTAENVVGKMTTKFLRGIVNVVTCPLELPRQISRQAQARGPVEGSCVGFFAGLGMTVFRALAGTAEAAMFLVPEPGFYDPLVTPAYPWQEWDAPVVE